MKSVVVLQARTNSSRLPAKVLLPVNGIPLAVLAAKRAGNKGRHVIVATSVEPSDDALAKLLIQNEINCHRGSLDNTLERFTTALNDYDDDTLVFRLTADNVFPDGLLLDEMEQDFLGRGLEYLSCNGERAGLPYGMSAELTRLRHLREALAATTSKHDQEHVTPYVRRKFGESFFEKYKALNKGHFRCTVDCLDDYLTIQQVFSRIKDPIQVSAFDMVSYLIGAPYQPAYSAPAVKFVLGTAQLGLDYGIANVSGKPDFLTSERIIKTAIANGVQYVDTARAYGNSEEIIGNVLRAGWEGRSRIVTKLSPLAGCPVDASTETVNAFVDASIYSSCTALRVQRLDVLMLHRASHLLDWEGAAWTRLLEHKSKGTLNSLGISVQSPEELNIALSQQDVSFIQMPFNVLDWRWDHIIPKIIETKKKRPLVVHVRSVLLQGLLSSHNHEHWLNANVKQPALIIQWLIEQADISGSASITEFCLNFVKSCDWVDGLVVGTETLVQLAENMKIICSPATSYMDTMTIMASRPVLDEDSLNPACWK